MIYDHQHPPNPEISKFDDASNYIDEKMAEDGR